MIVYEEGGDAEITIGNPSPVVDEDTGTIWLPFCRNNKEVLITKSIDDGLTWSEPVNISNQVTRPEWTWVATGPGVSIQLRRGPHKGRLVVPSDHYVMVDEQRIAHSHMFYSDDHGETWQLGAALPEHTNECQVVELAGGELLLNMRSYWGRVAKVAERDGKRAVARSSNGGATWGGLDFDGTLIEPVCQASFIRYTFAEGGRQEPSALFQPGEQNGPRQDDGSAQLRRGRDLARLETAARRTLGLLLSGDPLGSRRRLSLRAKRRNRERWYVPLRDDHLRSLYFGLADGRQGFYRGAASLMQLLPPNKPRLWPSWDGVSRHFSPRSRRLRRKARRPGPAATVGAHRRAYSMSASGRDQSRPYVPHGGHLPPLRATTGYAKGPSK